MLTETRDDFLKFLEICFLSEWIKTVSTLLGFGRQSVKSCDSLGLPFVFCWEEGEGKQQGQTANVRRKRIKERHRVKHLGFEFINMKESVVVSLFSPHSSTTCKLRLKMLNFASFGWYERQLLFFPPSSFLCPFFLSLLSPAACCSVHLHYSIFQTASVKNRGLFVAD